ncbi:amidohydrolase family protein [Flavobacteriaceae bacterium S356]|uniref:Amidohydrolase family protein n=1 Tax=Asprobacillus argus TaxID=3076534 RepID=A0ABU3LDI4_9FLAO|nr:amidohydrolase family protein [Flavobacteriaceae bacterium S356]
MCRYLIITVIILFAFSCNGQNYARKNKNSKRIQLNNGHWFNGKIFEKKTVWVKEGLLHFNTIGEADTVIDLSGKFVIPPFADAHNHNLESKYELQERIAAYLDNGVFYVKLLSTIKRRITPVLHNYNEPSKLDVRMTHAPLTAKDGHPIGVRKRYLYRGYYRGMFNTLEELEFHGYVRIDTEQDLEQKWERVLESKPDFIKINLLYSEEYEKRKDDSIYFGRKGLNPKFVSKIVEKAHAANLKVSAHVETAYDFHVAVTAGVDEVAHLPEISHGQPINRKDAALASKKGIRVVTTASLVLKRQKQPNYQQLVANIVFNLKLLQEEGVEIAIGSDQYNGNSVGEFQFLYGLDVFTNTQLLNMWTRNATKAVFPRRKVGELKEGYEASFLVLNKNPLLEIKQINKHITMLIKQGVLLK